MSNKTELSSGQIAGSPDYEKLARFLIEPFLENPQSLCVNSEINQSNGKIWLRIAFDRDDRGKVFGRGGRNIQAIRTTIKTAAVTHNESVFISEDSGNRGRAPGNSRRRKSPGKPAPKIAKK